MLAGFVSILLLIATLGAADHCGSSTPSSASSASDARGGRSNGESSPGRLAAESARGLYRVELWPADGEIPIQRLHAWHVRIHDASGEVATVQRIEVDGGMDAHGHGFDTKPRVTNRLPNGDYLIDGVKFHMSGRWQMDLDFVAQPGPDRVRFEIDVGP